MFENQKYGKRVKEFSEMWETLRIAFFRHPLSEKISDTANKYMAHSLWCNGEKAVPEKLLKNSKIVLKLLALCLDDKYEAKIAAQTRLDDFLKGENHLTEKETDALYFNLDQGINEAIKIQEIFWNFHARFIELGLKPYRNYRAYVKTDFDFEKAIEGEK